MNWFQNLWKGLGGVAKGAGKAVGSVFNPVGAASSFGQNLGQNVLSSFMQPKQQAQSAGKSTFQNIPGMMGALPNPRMGAMQPPPSGISTGDMTATPAKKQGYGKSIMDFFGSPGGKIGAGMLSNFAGQAFAPKVNVPDIGSLQSVQNLRGFDNSSLPQGVSDSINRTVDIEHEQQLRRLRDVYKNARPGTDYTTDSAYQRDMANLERQQTLNRSDAQSNALLQFNQQELQHLSEVAQQDIYSIMIKLGMDAQEAEQFKQSFSNIGSMFMQSGLGLNQFSLKDWLK